MKKSLCILFGLLTTIQGFAQQNCYWQQKVDYSIQADVDDKNARYDGKMKLVYTNNSPDVLDKVYFHLYYNAFQPGSAMDMRLRNIEDPDSRMVERDSDGKTISRISKLGKDDIGYQKINFIKQNGKNLTYKIS
mgnify:CR=1 FL=1